MISLAVRQSHTARVFSYLPASWLLLLLQQCRANSRPASAAATPGLGHTVAVRCRGRAPKTFATLPYLQLSVTDVKGPFFSALGIKPAHSACRMLGLMSRLRVLLVLLRVTFLRRSIGHMRRRLRNVVLRMVFCALCAFRHIRLRVVTRRVRHVMRRLFR